MTQQIASKVQLMTSVSQLASGGLIRPGLPAELDQYDEARILMAVRDVQTLAGPQSLLDFRLAEFRAVRRAATYGEPPVPAATPGGPARFEVVQHHVRTIRSTRGLALRVTPVERLEVVLVLRGFIRQISVNPPLDPDEVTCSFQADGNEWYPGIELFGEGIFVDFPDGLVLPLAGPGYTSPMAADWMTEFRSRRAELDENHPCFVWWHSLAHRLITALALDSGFGAASIRERVYCETDASGRAEGGILLYSTQPGGDGTLGGLIAMVPHMERVLERALADLHTCSNDPLCWENTKRPGSTLGSACYSCLFVSETSCEHRNHYLDRRVVQEFPI